MHKASARERVVASDALRKIAPVSEAETSKQRCVAKNALVSRDVTRCIRLTCALSIYSNKHIIGTVDLNFFWMNVDYHKLFSVIGCMLRSS